MIGILLSDGNKVYFGQGNFDNWCVYYEDKIGKQAFQDIKYFKFFKMLAQKYGVEKVYQDFITIYNQTSNEIVTEIVHNIKNIAKQYEDESTLVERYLSVIYLAMIAEENKENTKLGKRIKRLGIHNLLIDDNAPEVAANASRNVNWKTLDGYCLERGF